MSNNETPQPGFSEEFARLSRRDQRDTELLENAFGEALVVNRQVERPAQKFGSMECLVKVVAELAEDTEAGMTGVDGQAEAVEQDQRLHRLLAPANHTSRKIELSGSWWKSGGMALIAWTKSGRPVALRPSGRGGYIFFDPETAQTGRVDQAFAETLAETAHAVYPTLLGDKVRFRDLVGTGLRNGVADAVFLAVFGATAALVSLATPTITAVLVNTAIPQGEQSIVFEMSVILVSVAIIVAVFQFLQATALLRVETIFESQVSAALWHRLLRMPSDLFRRFNSGNLAIRVTDLSRIRKILSQGIVTAVLGGIFATLNFVVMIIYGGWLTVAALVMMLLTVAFALIANRMKFRRLRKVITVQQDLVGQSMQVISAIRKLRVAGAENRMLSRLIGLHNEQRFHVYGARSIGIVIRAFNTIIPLLSAAVFFLVIEFLFDNPPPTGDFVAFTVAYGSFIAGMIGLVNSVTMGLIAAVIFERLKPLLETPPEIAEGSLPPGRQSGHIEMNQVTFRYRKDGRAAVHNVSLTIKPGQFVAIVGPSGSGKSTLLRLLLGLERPQSGSILYDGKDLAKMDVAALRQQFGAVLQNAQVLVGSILENISVLRAVTLEDAWKAAKRVGLDKTIRAMPLQMLTPLTGYGNTISGGERQRLMLARALAGKPSILFLDEATSALDNVTQAVVTDTLSNLDVTRVVIAHRLSTVRDADVIFVMQDGKIAEFGNAQTLLKKGGVFSSLVEQELV